MANVAQPIGTRRRDWLGPTAHLAVARPFIKFFRRFMLPLHNLPSRIARSLFIVMMTLAWTGTVGLFNSTARALDADDATANQTSIPGLGSAKEAAEKLKPYAAKLER